MLSGIAISSVVVLAGFTSRVNAHGYLEHPKPSWKDDPNPEWVVNVDNYWDIGSGGDQAGKFKTMAKEKGMSVRDVALDMVKDQKCGNTLENGAPQSIPSDGKVMWLGNGGGGFTHQGPCEVYIDDKMVLHGDNCEEEFPVNCVPLEGSGGSATQTQSSQTSSQSTETSTKQGSAGQENEKSPAPVVPSTEQQSNQNPLKETNATEAPSSDQQNQTPSSEQKTTQAPSAQQDQEEEQKRNQDQHQNQAPSPQQGQQDQQQQQQQQQPAQTPSNEQQTNQAPSNRAAIFAGL